MTQIIGAVTQEYVLLSSDRRLTYGEGVRKGEVYDDDTCKLVSLCGTTGIAYSGVGEMQGQLATHKWIAQTLAEAGCQDAACAERTLIARAPSALCAVPRAIRRHIFVLAGWAYFEEPPILRPYVATVTNGRDTSGNATLEALDSFNSSRRYLRAEEDLLCFQAGESITNTRAGNLEKNLRRLIGREIGPKEALRLLVDEIINTSKRCDTVGSKILGFCIPKKGAQRFFEKGQSVMLATLPNSETTAFTYFEEGYNELKQYGPTTVCGEWAVTDVETQNDPSRDFQSSQMRILSLPKSKPDQKP